MLDILIIIPEITKGMKSLGSKSLLTIKKRLSVIDYQITEASKILNKHKITLVIGFEHDKVLDTIKDHSNLNIDYIVNDNYKNTNQAYALKLFYQKYPDVSDLLIISSGVLLKDQVINKYMLKDISKLFLLNKPKENFELGCSDNREKAEYIFYDLPAVWSECIYLNKEGIEITKDIVLTEHADQMYLFEAINTALNKNLHIEKCIIDKRKVMKINNQRDIAKAKVFI